MYIATLVDDVQKVVERLREERGTLVLAMLYAREQGDTGWNFIVSSRWADELGRAEATGVVTRALSEGLGLENKPAISRVTILPTKDPFVREITSFYQIASPGAGQWVRNTSAAGITIGTGFIFFSQQN